MATRDQKADERLNQSFHMEQRRALNNAYALVTAQQNIQTFHRFTFEEAMDKQIKQIEGDSTKLRETELARVDRIESQVQQAVEEIKQIDPERFLHQDPLRDVNTEEDAGGQ